MVDCPSKSIYNLHMRIIVSVAQDVGVLAGVCAMVYGAYQIYAPAGYIIFGVLAVSFWLLGRGGK